jgi:phage terminase large subunit-like protein
LTLRKPPSTRRTRRLPTSREADPVTAYASAVADGRIVAGPHVRAACARHLRDLKEGHKRGLYFDADAARHVIGFYPAVLTVIQDGKVVPFNLVDWQAFAIGSIFGWKRANGTRRFRKAYLETAKGSGKSPLAAGLGLFGLLSDHEPRPEIYAAASSKSQAMVLFRDAVSMVDSSPHLRKRLVKSGGNPVWQLSAPSKGGFFKPIANDDTQSGPRPHFAIIDELHEVKDRYIVDMLEAGFKGRRQPLLFMITNSGHNRQTICWEMHEHGVKVASGKVEDDEFFALIFSIDDGDDPLHDKTCWIKTNPSLGVTIREDYLESQVAAARFIPGKQNAILRLNFCVWTDADQAWLARAAWERCETPLQLEMFRGRKVWGGLDMSFSQDLTALALVFKLSADRYALFVEFWTPEETAQSRADRDKVPYLEWIRDGLIHGAPGKVVKLPHIARRMAEIADQFDLQTIAFDRYRHKELEDDLAELGIDLPMIEHPQGFRRAGQWTDRDGRAVKDDKGKPAQNPLWMPSSVEETEHAIIEGRLLTPVHKVLRWNVAGVVMKESQAGTAGMIPDKRKATGRIDGIVAAFMAIGAAKADIGANTGIDDFLRNPVVSR